MNKAGLCPVVIRVTVDRKPAYRYTSHRLALEDWDDHNHQVKTTVDLSQLINASIDKMVADAKEFLITAYLNKQMVTAKQVVSSLWSDGGRDDLLAYWRKLLADLRGIQSYNTLRQFKMEYDKVSAFRSNLTFGEVTPEFLRQLDQWLCLTVGNSQNTRWKTFKNLKKIFNLARKDKRTTLYPFKSYDCPRYTQKLRTSLTKAEVDKIEQLVEAETLAQPLCIVANYFLLSCYTGLRYQDLQSFDPEEHAGQERLIIPTRKTGEIVSIKCHSRLNAVIDRLTQKNGLLTNQKVNEYLKKLSHIAGIKKRLTVHVGRHTFAVLSATLGIPSEVVMKLLGHTNIRTTQIYYKITDTQVDAQMAKWEGL